ncbi:MAG: protoheme IX farnesyltransferase [Armatimonadetes bacterium]|nr:protoheme IX farnesyltransferase [Armatimonadota bacterium]
MIRRYLQLLLKLTKFRIAILSTISASSGYIAGTSDLTIAIWAPTLGTLLLAMGALALNEYQERDIDALMPRTAGRPIPAGQISPRTALLIASALIMLGADVLLIFCGLLPCGLGLLTVFWYNGVYTYLKRWTAFAVVPGSVVGALPPMIGWSSADRLLSEPAIFAIAFFFFIWQIPHFWLLLHRLGSQYEQAQLRSLTQVFSDAQMRRVTFVWISATAVSCLLLPMYGATSFFVTSLGLLFSALWLIWRSMQLLRNSADASTFRSTFMSINAFAVLVILLMTADQIVRMN